MIAVLITIGVIAVFAFVEAVFAIGIMAGSTISSSKKTMQYTVVIAARNEADNIRSCIKSVLQQNIPPNAVIIIDDHSEDQTLNAVYSIAAENPSVVALSCAGDESGKRAALMKGVLAAASDVILTTDADCIVHREWAATMLSKLSDDKKLFSGPVVNKTNGFRNALQYAESLYLVAMGAGAAEQGMMFQSSGANMIFSKSDFLEFHKSALGAAFNCGDDVFFLQFLKKKYGKTAVGFCNSASAVVITQPCINIRSWILQRVRWAGKSRGYSGSLPFLMGSLVAVSNIAFTIALLFLFLFPEMRFFILPGIMLKVMGDILILFSAAFSWKIPIRFISFFLLPVFYPIFLLSVGATMILQKNKTWKGRNIK